MVELCHPLTLQDVSNFENADWFNLLITCRDVRTNIQAQIKSGRLYYGVNDVITVPEFSENKIQ